MRIMFNRWAEYYIEDGVIVSYVATIFFTLWWAKCGWKNALYLLNVFRTFYYNTDYNTDKDMKNVDLCDETLYSFAGIYLWLE